MKKIQTLCMLALLGLSTITAQTQLCFDPAINFAVGITYNYNTSVTSADFNGDGKIDLATTATTNSGPYISVMLSNGTDTFASSVNYAVGTNPISVTSGDFNGDGKADLATVGGGNGLVSLLIGSGTGTFATPVNYTVGLYPNSVFSADLNGDDNADLVVTNHIGEDISILYGSNNGTFTSGGGAEMGGTRPSSGTSADFNGDGNLDLAITCTGRINILLSTGNGTFTPPINYDYNYNVLTPCSIISADFNGDGKADLAAANNAYILPNDTTGYISILLGSGTGTFASAVNYVVNSPQLSITSADFNGDGKADLATANRNANGVSVLLGSGTGTFAPAINYAVALPISLISADFNGDGKTDLVTGNDVNTISILLNCNTTGINQFKDNNKQMMVYPNPNNGIFNLQLNGEMQYATISIIDVLGKEVYNSIFNTQSKYNIDLSNQATGIYYIIVNNKGKQYRNKVMVTR